MTVFCVLCFVSHPAVLRVLVEYGCYTGGQSSQSQSDCLSTPPPSVPLTPHLVMVTNNVDMEEANILADFFNLQATKHGPEMVRKLNNIGGLKQVSGQESRVVAQKQSAESAGEQRKQIKIEVEAETVINQEIKLERGGPVMTQPGLQLLLPPGQTRLGGAVQYFLSQEGRLVPLMAASPSPASPSRPRGVSVIQRAPGPGAAANPNIILERRVEEVSVYSHHSSHSPPGESRHRMIDTTTAGSQDTSLTGPTLGGKHSNKLCNTGRGS